MQSSVKISPVNMDERKALGLRSGDSVRVWQKVVDLKKQKQANKKEVLATVVRRQAFEGTILAVKHGSEAGATFTVRKIASGVGTERIFPLYSPGIDTIEVLRRARTRRAKLYFIRRKAASEVKHAMRKQIAIDTRGKRTDTKQAEALAPEAAAAPQTAEAAVE